MQEFLQVSKELIDLIGIKNEAENEIISLKKPTNPYWTSFKLWKVQFKALNHEKLKDLSKKERSYIYKKYFNRFYKNCS